MKKILLSLCVGSLLFAGCKDDKDVTCELNSAGIVGSYKVTAITYKATAASTPVDVFSTLDPCTKDDLIVLNANNSVTYTDAGVQCVPAGNDTGMWSLSGSNINLDGDISVISGYSCAGMTATYTDPVTGEIYTTTLARQ